MDNVPSIIDSTLSPSQGWVRIELEPVNIPLEQDDSILLSTVQSVIPGAHGLYYKDNDCKKALKYNGTTGCILKGPPGWNSKPIYVVLAHGCRHFSSSSSEQYANATERFEKTVNLVQRMLGKSDQQILPQSHKKDTSIRLTECNHSDSKLSSFEAQIANESGVDSEGRNNGSFISEKCSKTSTDIQKFDMENNISNQSQLMNEIGKEEQNDNLIEKLKQQKKKIKELEKMLDDERNKAQLLANLNAELNNKLKCQTFNQQQSKFESDRMQQQSSRNDLNEKNDEIDKLNKQIDDLKWSLGEYKQWLNDANERIYQLVNACKEKDDIIDDVTHRFHDVERRLLDVPTDQSIANLNSLINEMRKEINDKNDCINQLEKAKSDAQWYLGEHQHWLQNANTRIEILENEKLDGWQKVCQLEEMLNEVRRAIVIPNDNNSEIKAKLEEMQQNIKDKIYECEKLNEQNNEMKNSIEEYKVCLENATKRITYLEDEEMEKDRLILAISKELVELKEVRIDTFQQLHEKIDSLEYCLNKKEQQIMENESTNDENEYKKAKWSLRDLDENIFDVDNGHFNESTESNKNANWTFAEYKHWLQNLKKKVKELENALQRITNEKDAAIEKLHEFELNEPNMDELKKGIWEKEQQIIQLEKDFNEKQNELNLFGLRIENLMDELNDAKENSKNYEQKWMDTEWILGEHRQWLTDAKKKIDELENKLQIIGEENSSLREEIEKLNYNIRISAEAIEGLQKEIDDKNVTLNDISKEKIDFEWNFNEKQQQLKDANNRIDELESILTEKNHLIDELKKCNEEEMIVLHEKLQNAEKAFSNASCEDNKLNELSSVVDCLQNELNGKNEFIKSLTKECNDKEWSLGEYRQWLHDSKNRVQDLEKELCKCNDYVEKLKQEIENRNTDTSNYLATINGLNDEFCAKNVCIANLEKAKNDLELSLSEHQQWLQNANERIVQLEECKIANDAMNKELHNEMDKLSKMVVLDLKAALEAVKEEAQQVSIESIDELMVKLQNTEQALAEHPKLDDLIYLKNENENLRELLNDKNACIDNLVQQNNDREWSLGEHRQWLRDCNDRANWLDGIVLAKNAEIDELRCENNRLKIDLTKISQNDDINKLNATIGDLRNEINNKNNHIDEIIKQRNETEWKLGEHCQMLEDANNRANELAEKLAEKEKILNSFLEKQPEIVEEKCDKINAIPIEAELINTDKNESESMEIDKSKLFEKIFELEKKLLEAEKVAAEVYDNNHLKITISEHEATIAKLKEDLNQKDVDLVRVCKERCDAEWFLGEERQRTKDANERIALLEAELTCVKAKHDDIVHDLSNEVFELNEKNKKLNETLIKTKIVIRNLSKDSQTTMLLLEQTKEMENLEEEFKQLCKKYAQLSALLVTIQEYLEKIEPEVSEVVNFRKIIENLNNEFHQQKLENENLLKQKNDIELQLSEHCERLRNANNRISILEDELTHLKEVNGRTIEILRMENEALNQKNIQLKENVKHLQDEIQNALINGKKEIELQNYCECKEIPTLNRIESIGIDISSINCSLENLCKELNYQKIIDTLMEQRSKTEQLLNERKESITDACNEIIELEKQILENTLEEQLETIEIVKEFDNADNGDKKAEIENLMRLKSELEQNLKEANVRNEEMSALLDKKEQTIDAIINEKKAIEVERNCLQQQVDNLKQQCHNLSPFATNISHKGENETELMIRLCEKDDQLQQFTTEIAEKVEEITNLHQVIKDLRDVIGEKNRIIDDLNRITSEKEWNLGEYRQWLTDANNKIDILERELSDVRHGAKLNKIELDKLTSEIDEKNAKISQLHNKIAKLESDAINVQYEKESLPNEDFSSKLSVLHEKLSNMEEYVQFQDEELRRLKEEHAQTLANQQNDVSPTSTAIQSHGIGGNQIMSEEYNELSSELIILNRKKYELEEKVKRLENELQSSYEKVKGHEDEQRRIGEEIWLAKERVANQERELQDLHGQCTWLRDENARLQSELTDARKKHTENGGIDWSKFDEMKKIEETLRDEKSKVEWRLGEVTQYWNDAKWKIGELEAGMAHKEWLLDQANQKIFELDQMYRFRDTTKNFLDGTFLIKKQPSGDRYKWRLAMWNESSPNDLKDYRRIWFEIRAPTAKIVLLSASFVSWECFLLCQQLDNDCNRFGVWIDIPPGRYEFLFIVDGQWTISDNYEICWNEHGTHNNWRNVD